MTGKCEVVVEPWGEAWQYLVWRWVCQDASHIQSLLRKGGFEALAPVLQGPGLFGLGESRDA